MSKEPYRWESTPLVLFDDPACEGLPTNEFFKERYLPSELKIIKAICADCPVHSECLEYSLKWKIPYGVWGGSTPRERIALRRLMNVRI